MMKTQLQFFPLLFILCFSFSIIYGQKSPNFVDHYQRQQAAKIDAVIAQSVKKSYDLLRPSFESAYRQCPTLPRGVLEAISYVYTRFEHVRPKPPIDTLAIPPTYGAMGLTLDGRHYFRDNLLYISELANIPSEKIINQPDANILAYAIAFQKMQEKLQIFSDQIEDYAPIFVELSELPINGNIVQNFAVQSLLYNIYVFLSDDEKAQLFDFQHFSVDFEKLFGAQLPLLRAPEIFVRGDTVSDNVGNAQNKIRAGQTDYSGATWVPAGSCNYSSRNGRAVSSITIHYTSGTYSGALAWFQNCTYNGVGAQASAHYLLRSSDGQITQMVREADKAWHVGSANGYCVGVEHEAYGNVQNYFTSAMYQSSADLVRDICQRHNISPLRIFYRDTLDDGTALNSGLHSLGGETACTKIRGHQHYPSQTHTDPGPYWNWNYYYKLINANPTVQRFTTFEGEFTDSGGANGNYSNDERALYLIQVADNQQVTLDFLEFDLENNYDFMWIYDGDSPFAPLLGRWNTQAPPQIHSTGNALLIEFRSDCATTAAGWRAKWTSSSNDEPLPPLITDNEDPTTDILFAENQWVTDDFEVAFIDYDNVGIQSSFYQIMENHGDEWCANSERGFLCHNFDRPLSSDIWQIHHGTWSVENNRLMQSQLTDNQAVISTSLNGELSQIYLYDFYAAIEAGENFSFIIGVDNISGNNMQNGYRITISARENSVAIYKIKNGVSSLLEQTALSTNLAQNYFYRILHDRVRGELRVYRHNQLIISALDTQPLTTRSQRIALMTHKAQVSFDNMRTYRLRGERAQVLVGNGAQNDISAQAVNGAAKAKIKSIVLDVNDRFSGVVEKSVLVDYTPPSCISGMSINRNLISTNHIVTSSIQAHTSEFITTNNLRINWSSVADVNSSVLEYYIMIKPVDNQNNSNNWIPIRRGTSFDTTLTDRRYSMYKIYVKSKNRAGLFSPTFASPTFSIRNNNLIANQRIATPRVSLQSVDNEEVTNFTRSTIEEFDEIIAFPNPAQNYVELKIEVAENVPLTIFNMYGQKVKCTQMNGRKIDVTNLKSGVYIGYLQFSDKPKRFKILKL